MIHDVRKFVVYGALRIREEATANRRRLVRAFTAELAASLSEWERRQRNIERM